MSQFGFRVSASPDDAGQMSMDDRDLRPQVADVGRLAKRAVQGMVGVARAADRPTWRSILRDHLGPQASALDIVDERWNSYEQVNVQAGLDAWLADGGAEREHRVVGITGFQHHLFGLADLMTSTPQWELHGPRPGNVARQNLPSGPDGRTHACLRCALVLVTEGGTRSVIFVRGAEMDSGQPQAVLQIVSTDEGRALEIAAEVRALILEHNVFRGQVLSFGNELFGHGESILNFHERPQMSASDLILPDEVLAGIQRQVVGVANHREALRQAGQHLKRGLLLYGPPGVGKTHTVRYLISKLRDLTIIQVTGQSLESIGQACAIARTLEPSMVVVEDVDLIAEDRGMYPGEHPLLFQLLNEMDGLAEEADVVFLLTTNRADLLEPALASRPGRVDQAVEIGLPDDDARRRLLDLYRADLQIDESNVDTVLRRTAGVTASFIKELIRRAAVWAAERSDDQQGSTAAEIGRAPQTSDRLHVTSDDLNRALDELLDTRNAMTRTLLGGSPVASGRDGITGFAPRKQD